MNVFVVSRYAKDGDRVLVGVFATTEFAEQSVAKCKEFDLGWGSIGFAYDIDVFPLRNTGNVNPFDKHFKDEALDAL